jgi:hypothetical protein
MITVEDVDECPTCHQKVWNCTCSRTDDEAKGAADELGLEDEDKDPKKK